MAVEGIRFNAGCETGWQKSMTMIQILAWARLQLIVP